MAARFYAGASIQATRKTSQAGKSPPPQSNSMKGLPGYIKTTQDKSDSGLASSKGVGPKREGSIGRKGDGGNRKFNTAAFGGSSDKSYYGTSTGPAGRIRSNKGTPQSRPAIDQRDSGRRSGNNRAPMQGHPGRMESLKGRFRTSAERR